MKFPAITHHIEAVSNLEERLRTIKNIKPILDKSGEPLFYASKGVLTFRIENKGVINSLKCFTSVSGFENTINLLDAEIINGEVLQDEIFVFNNDGIGDYYPIVITNDNREIKSLPTEYFMEGLIPFEEQGKWGYKSDKDKVVISPKFDFAGEFGEGRAVVGISEYYGLIDKDGNSIINIEFDDVSWDGSALAYVDRGGLCGCFDRSGRIVVDCLYEWIAEFSQGLLLVCKNSKYGYVNLKGEEVIPLVYDSATSFDENSLANVETMGKQYTINTKGELE